jgi:hypothetical protein
VVDKDGLRRGLESFYRHLPLLNMRCELDKSRLAVWWSTEHVNTLEPFFLFFSFPRCNVDMACLGSA